MLNDWTHELSDKIYARYEETGAFPFCVDSVLANGQGRVNCLPDSVLKDAAGDGMHSEMSDMPDMPDMHDMPDMSSLTPRGCAPPMMFKPGYNRSDLPPETCTNTSSPLLNIAANNTRGWLALHLVNAGATSALGVSLDGHSMYVYGADGGFVELLETQVSNANTTVAHHGNMFRYCICNLAKGTLS